MNSRTKTLLGTFGAALAGFSVLVVASIGVSKFLRPASEGRFLAPMRSNIPAAVTEGDGPASTLPSYAPNGSEVAFVTQWRDALEIWAVSTADGSLRSLVSDPNAAMIDPSWSPSGAWIALASNRTGYFNIWQVHPDGSSLTRVTTGFGMDHQPTWSPDSTKVALVSNRTGSRAVWIVNSDGSGLRRVTNLSGQESHPSFSPDGTQLVFAESDGTQSNLWIVNADGTGMRQLTTGAFRDRDPSWSARGVAFTSDRSGPYAIWLVQPNGTGLQAIPNAIGTNPSWSSDATKVAFSNGPINEFNFVDSTIRQVLKITGYSINISAYQGPWDGPGIGYQVWVSILSSPNFDPVNSIDRASITFGVTGDENSIVRDPATGSPNCGADYSRGTGVPDLLCESGTYPSGLSTGGPSVILRATDVNKTRYEGRYTMPPPPIW